MSRPLRVQYPGAWHHVMNRGASRREVFPAPADRDAFLRLLGEIRVRFRVEIHAYCIMGNHYHLLVRTREPNLDRAMRHLDGVYTQSVHRRHGGDGAIFRGRYRSLLIQADRHLLQVSRYLHLNPVEAGLVGRPEDWQFSSFRGYLDPGRAESWLSTAVILSHFGSIGGRRRYRAFVEEGLDPGTRDFYGRQRIPPVLGDEQFRCEVRRRAALEPAVSREEIPGITWIENQRPVPLSVIGNAVSQVFGVTPEALRARTTRGPARGAFVHAALRLSGHRLREIAAWIGWGSHHAAAKAAARFSRRARTDPGLAALLAQAVRVAATPAPEEPDAAGETGNPDAPFE